MKALETSGFMIKLVDFTVASRFLATRKQTKFAEFKNCHENLNWSSRIDL